MARLLALAVLMAACANPPVSTKQPPVPLSLPSTTAASSEVRITEQGCDTPPLAFAVLCEAYELLSQNHVKEVEAPDLASAAILGVTGYEADSEGQPPIPIDHFTCAIPADAFAEMCEAIATQLEDSPADMTELVEAAVVSMVSRSYDPYTIYLPPGVLDAVGENGVMPAIGVLAAARDEAGSHCVEVSAVCPLEIVIVLEGGTAEAAGLSVGDVVKTIDGAVVDGLTVFEVAELLDGGPGTSVSLEIERADATQTVLVTRGEAEFPIVTGQVVKKGVGYIRIPEFTFDAQIVAHFVLVDLENQNVRTVILDLRDNPGGVVDGAVSLASEFLPNGNVLEAQYRDGIEEKYPVRDGGVFTNARTRLIVLVNEGSASASEILAAVLQERDRAVIVGQPTFGKNLIQLPYQLHNGGELRVTIATWTTPKGASVADGGLKPDVKADLGRDLAMDELVEKVLDLT